MGRGPWARIFSGVHRRSREFGVSRRLLKSSTEALGRGSLGSTYKAVTESGYIVTVKRLKDARFPHIDEFRQRMDLLGSLRHPNVVPHRAYFQAKEERLLIYDYFPSGSLFTLYGSRTLCLKIAEDLAASLLFIHQSHGLAHGKLKSSNALLGTDFESCVMVYCLTCFQDPNSLQETRAASLFYKAPECRNPGSPATLPSDIYSFGMLLLELLMGRITFQDLELEHGSDIPRWVKSVLEEEMEYGTDPDNTSSNEVSEEMLQTLLNIAMACVCNVPVNRSMVREVLNMIRNARSEAQV